MGRNVQHRGYGNGGALLYFIIDAPLEVAGDGDTT